MFLSVSTIYFVDKTYRPQHVRAERLYTHVLSSLAATDKNFASMKGWRLFTLHINSLQEPLFGNLLFYE